MGVLYGAWGLGIARLTTREEGAYGNYLVRFGWGGGGDFRRRDIAYAMVFRRGLDTPFNIYGFRARQVGESFRYSFHRIGDTNPFFLLRSFASGSH